MSFSPSRACVLHCLRTRYKVLQIYTYSGLFCICINPYKWLMVYTPVMRAHFRNRRRTDAPPHLYAVADGALQLLEMGKNFTLLLKIVDPPWRQIQIQLYFILTHIQTKVQVGTRNKE